MYIVQMYIFCVETAFSNNLKTKNALYRIACENESFLLDICSCLHTCLTVTRRSEVKWLSSIMGISWNYLYRGSAEWRVDVTGVPPSRGTCRNHSHQGTKKSKCVMLRQGSPSPDVKHEVTGKPGHVSELNGNVVYLKPRHVEMSILGGDSICYMKPFIHRNKKSSPIQRFKIIYKFT